MENTCYRLCAFAFLDILGFKNIVESIGTDSRKAESFIHTLTDLIEGSIETILTYNSLNDVHYQIFSDSICIWVFLDEDDSFDKVYSYDYIEKSYYSLLKLCMIVASIQRRGVYDDLLFRGAISIGYHYHHNNVTVSQALIKAYLAESKESIYPRVILLPHDDKFIISALLDSLIASGYVLDDDWPFVDYLNTIYGACFFEKSVIEGFLEAHKSLIETRSKMFSSNKSICSKYRWLAQYHNKKLRHGFEKYSIKADF